MSNREYDPETRLAWCCAILFLVIFLLILDSKFAWSKEDQVHHVELAVKDDSVSFVHFTREMLDGFWVAQRCAEEYNLELVITSANDGRHKRESKHYEGNALDYRTLWWSRNERIKFYHCLKENSHADFDVIFEGNHIHHEYDPK